MKETRYINQAHGDTLDYSQDEVQKLLLEAESAVERFLCRG